MILQSLSGALSYAGYTRIAQKLASACLSEGASDEDKSRQEFPAAGTPIVPCTPLLPGILGATWSILTFRQASTEHRKDPDRPSECLLSAPNPTEMGPLEYKDTPYDENVRNRMQNWLKVTPPDTTRMHLQPRFRTVSQALRDASQCSETLRPRPHYRPASPSLLLVNLALLLANPSLFWPGQWSLRPN